MEPDPAPRVKEIHLLDPRRALLACLPVVALFARLYSQPGHLQDGEGQIPATIARELSQVGFRDVFHYQVVDYQGSLVVDPILASLGYTLFGDHIMAWHGLALVYMAVLAYSLSSMLVRVGAHSGAWVVPMLLAASPFALKDGMLAMIGGHGPGIVYTCAALNLLLWAEPRGRKLGLVILAGFLWGVGAWYIRTAYVAVPALFSAVARLGWRALLLGLLGGLVFPALLLFQADMVTKEVPRYEVSSRAQVFRKLTMLDSVFRSSSDLGNGPAEGVSEGGDMKDLAGRTSEFAEMSWWVLRRGLFAQPNPPGDANQDMPAVDYVSTAWVIAWLLACPLTLALLLWRRRWGSLPVVLLLMGYLAAYLIAPERVEPVVVLQMLDAGPHHVAPPVNPVRYIIPVGFAWVGLLALGLSMAWEERRARPMVTAVLLLLVGPGIGYSMIDVSEHRSGAFSELHPARYESIDLDHRFPPIDVHLRSMTLDKESRAYRFLAMGKVAQETGLSLSEVEGLLGGLSPSAEESDIFYRGFGHSLAIKLIDWEPGCLRRLARELEDSRSPSNPSSHVAIVDGVAKLITRELIQALPREALDSFCSPPDLERSGACWAVIRSVDFDLGARVPEAPDHLLAQRFDPETLSKANRAVLVEALGLLYAGAAERGGAPGLEEMARSPELGLWEPSDREAFLRGLGVPEQD